MKDYKCSKCDSEFNRLELGKKLVEMVESGDIKAGDRAKCPVCKAVIENSRELFISRFDVSPIKREDRSSSLYGMRPSVPPLAAIVLCPMCRSIFVDAPALPKTAECPSCNTQFCLERGDVAICFQCQRNLMLPQKLGEMDEITEAGLDFPGFAGKWPVKCTGCQCTYWATA